jgi:hypothetical protein
LLASSAGGHRVERRAPSRRMKPWSCLRLVAERIAHPRRMTGCGAPVVPALDPVRMIEPPLPINGSAFWTVKIVPFTLVLKVSSMCLHLL